MSNAMREKYNQLCAQIGLGGQQADGYWPQLTEEEKELIAGPQGNPITMRRLMKEVRKRMQEGKGTVEETESPDDEIDAT